MRHPRRCPAGPGPPIRDTPGGARYGRPPGVSAESRPGGMVGPASAVWTQQRVAGIPRTGTVRSTQGIFSGIRHCPLTAMMLAVTADRHQVGPVNAGPMNNGRGLARSRSGAPRIEPTAEDARGPDLDRHHLSVRRRPVPDLGADSSRSVHRHPRAYHLWVFPAAHLGRDEFVGQGLASLLRPRPSDDHGSPFRYEVPELPAAAQRAWHRLGSTYCVAFGEGVGGDRMLYGERNARIGVVLRTRQGQVAVDG